MLGQHTAMHERCRSACAQHPPSIVCPHYSVSCVGNRTDHPLMARERHSEGYASNMLTSEYLTSLAMRRRCASDAVCISEDIPVCCFSASSSDKSHRAPGISIIHQWISSLQGVIEYSCLWLSFELQQFSMPARCYKNGPINLIRKWREREKRS